MKTRNETTKKSRVGAASPRPADAGNADPAAGVAAYPREHLIAEAAYYRAEKRGFAPDSELSDWLAAEAEVERMLQTRH